MEAKEYAYIRVSSRDQNEDRQKIAMVEYGIAPGNIYMDKLSAPFQSESKNKYAYFFS